MIFLVDMPHEILFQNSHNLASIVVNFAHQQTSSAHQSPQGSPKHNGFNNTGASSNRNKKWFSQPYQIMHSSIIKLSGVTNVIIVMLSLPLPQRLMLHLELVF